MATPRGNELDLELAQALGWKRTSDGMMWWDHRDSKTSLIPPWSIYPDYAWTLIEWARVSMRFALEVDKWWVTCIISVETPQGWNPVVRESCRFMPETVARALLSLIERRSADEGIQVALDRAHSYGKARGRISGHAGDLLLDGEVAFALGWKPHDKHTAWWDTPQGMQQGPKGWGSSYDLAWRDLVHWARNHVGRDMRVDLEVDDTYVTCAYTVETRDGWQRLSREKAKKMPEAVSRAFVAAVKRLSGEDG